MIPGSSRNRTIRTQKGGKTYLTSLTLSEFVMILLVLQVSKPAGKMWPPIYKKLLKISQMKRGTSFQRILIYVDGLNLETERLSGPGEKEGKEARGKHGN